MYGTYPPLLCALQDFARTRGVRVTFLVGDSHLAYAGEFYSNATS